MNVADAEKGGGMPFQSTGYAAAFDGGNADGATGGKIFKQYLINDANTARASLIRKSKTPKG